MTDFDDFMVTPVLIEHYEPTTDAHGDRVFTSTGATSVAAYLEPQSTVESLSGQTTATETWLMVLPAGTSISQHDMIVAGVHTFSVDGHPLPFGNVTPTGSDGHHIEVRLVRSAG